MRFYTSAIAAGDAAQVLTALAMAGEPAQRLVRATAAQVFQQLFPGRVRTMTLLSGTLLSIPLFERFPQASQQALDRVLARCASDPRCHAASRTWPPNGPAPRVGRGLPVTLPARQSPTSAAIQLDPPAGRRPSTSC